MSSPCSAKEREEIIGILEEFVKVLSDITSAVLTKKNTIKINTARELLDAVSSNTELGKFFLHALRGIADLQRTDIVSIAREVFDPSRFQNDCCSGGHCGCGGSQCNCK